MRSSKDLDRIKEKNDSKKSADDEIVISFSPILLAALVIGIIILVVGIVRYSNQRKLIGNNGSGNSSVETKIDSNNKNTSNTSSNKEVKIYKNGEKAIIDTNNGKYSLEVTGVKILPKTHYRDAVYQVFWEYENESCQRGISISEFDLKVVDSDGYVVKMMSEGWDGEWSNTYDSIQVGEKCEAYHTYKINNSACSYLDVKLDSEGIVFRIDVGYSSKPKEEVDLKKLERGEKVSISTSSGEIAISIDDIVKSESKVIKKGKMLLDVLCTVENISFMDTKRFTLSDLVDFIGVKDNLCESELYKIKKYINMEYNSFDDSIKQGDTMKVVLPYWINSEAECVRIILDKTYYLEFSM